MSEKLIPYGRQWIDKQDIKMVVKTLESDYLTTGPKIEEFEKKFADYVGAKYAVAIANGTAALHASCFAVGIKEGDEVITTPLSFAASANCILYQGGTPVFADIEEKTCNIDSEEIKKKITEKTKAIIPVHYTGQPCEMKEILNIAERHNLTVIEDGAHALGATYKRKKIGSIGEITTFSFHPVKHITTGEGGMVTTNSKEIYDKLIKFRSHGITKDKNKYRKDSYGPWYYEQQELGFNYRITDIQCALGIRQLDKADKFLKRRRKIAKRYNKVFKDIKGIEIPSQSKNVNSSWHIYVIKLELDKLTANREEIFKKLRAENVGVNVHYIPIYYHPYYQKLGYKKGICPKAEKIYERIVTIPLFPKMSNQDIVEVISRVKKVISYYQK